MNKIHTFVSFDFEHDRELYSRILEQSRVPSSGFSILGGSERATQENLGSEKARRQIREADQMIVICGEHTESSTSMSAELRIAQQEETPCIMLWGRREIMCTKPIGAKSSDGMYSWTLPVLQDQIALMARSAKWKNSANDMKRPSKLEAAKSDSSVA